jgi:acyl carrier protein
MQHVEPCVENPAGAVIEFVCATLAQACNRDRREISPDTQMRDLNMDSLTLVAVLAQVEGVYEIELTIDDVLSMIEATSVSELAELLAGLIARGR